MREFFVSKFKGFPNRDEMADAIVRRSTGLQIYEPVYIPWSFHFSPLECASEKDFENEDSYPDLATEIGEPAEPAFIQLDELDPKNARIRAQFGESTFVVT